MNVENKNVTTLNIIAAGIIAINNLIKKTINDSNGIFIPVIVTPFTVAADVIFFVFFHD